MTTAWHLAISYAGRPTGSLNAGVAQWLLGRGTLTAPCVAQGTAPGRRGRIHVSRGSDGTIRVGGRTQTIVTGIVVL